MRIICIAIFALLLPLSIHAGEYSFGGFRYAFGERLASMRQMSAADPEVARLMTEQFESLSASMGAPIIDMLMSRDTDSYAASVVFFFGDDRTYTTERFFDSISRTAMSSWERSQYGERPELRSLPADENWDFPRLVNVQRIKEKTAVMAYAAQEHEDGFLGVVIVVTEESDLDELFDIVGSIERVDNEP